MAKMVTCLLAIILGILFITPLVWMIVVSLKPEGVSAVSIHEWFQFSDLTLHNYVKVLTESNILLWTWNSFLIGALTTIICVVTSSLGAFAFSQKNFKTKAFFFILIASGLLIPTEAILIPLYETVFHMDLIDNIWGIILPGLTNPLGLLLLKQFMDGIPKEYMEAAKMDGGKDLRLWWSILPAAYALRYGVYGHLLFHLVVEQFYLALYRDQYRKKYGAGYRLADVSGEQRAACQYDHGCKCRCCNTGDDCLPRTAEAHRAGRSHDWSKGIVTIWHVREVRVILRVVYGNM